MPKVSIHTLGCKLNFAESATILRQFVEKGFEPVKFGEEADVVIINTCAVTTQAENKSKFAVKKALKTSPGATVIVIGCAAQVNPGKFEKIQGVDIIIGAKDKGRTFEIYENHSQRVYKTTNVFELKDTFRAYSLHERTRSFLKIQDGCDYVCSYCTIPKARGKSRNIPIPELVEEAKTIAGNGVKEIILTGVNIGDFGKTTGETFFDLIRELEKVEGIERYRISSIEPELLSDEILDFVAGSKKFMPHFHIPLQSGSDKILRLMQRRYNTKLFAKLIEKISRKIPHAFVGIDVIVGFPTETGEDFDQTFQFLKSLPFAYLHVFPYSDRPGTRASKITPKVPAKEKEKRVKILTDLSKQRHLEFYKKFLNTKRKVLFEKVVKDNKIFGFTDNYIRVAVPYDPNLTNEIKNVELLQVFENEFVIGRISD